MKRIGTFVLAIVCVMGLLMPLAQASDSGITDLKAVPYSAIQVGVSWQGTGTRYEVYYKPVRGEVWYYTEAFEDSVVIVVAPDTAYEITVNEPDGPSSEPVYVTTPRVSTTREYGYKYQSFSMYYTNADTNLDFWDDSSRTPFERIDAAVLNSVGTLRNFYVVSNFTLARAKQDKELVYLVVMYPPASEERYMVSGTVSIPADWVSAKYYYEINDIIEYFIEDTGSFPRGSYGVELYLNGWLGGKTTFIVQ